MGGSILHWRELLKRAEHVQLPPEHGLSNHVVLESYYFYLKVAGRAPDTIETYRRHLMHLVDFCNAFGLSFVTMGREDAMRWVSSMLDKVQPSSVNCYIRSFKAMFNWMVDEEFVHESPFRRIRPLTAEKKLRPTLTPEQVQKLLNSISKHTFAGARNRAMLMVAYDCMLRAGEILRLRVENIRLDECVVEVEKAKNHSFRLVPVTGATLRALHHYIWRWRKDAPGDILFCCQDGQKMKRGAFNVILRRVGKAANIRVHPHMLRRSGATGYVRNGGNMETVRMILGHSSIVMTQRYVQMADREALARHEDFSPAARLKQKAS